MSHNTCPDYHPQGLTRDLMRFHVRPLADPEERIAQTLGFLGPMADSGEKPDTHRPLLNRRLDDLLELPRNYLYRDELAETNLPVYSHQLVGHAGRHGLAFISEATFSIMRDRAFPERVREILGAVAHGDIVLKEQ